MRWWHVEMFVKRLYIHARKYVALVDTCAPEIIYSCFNHRKIISDHPIPILQSFSVKGIILCMRSANERRRYIVTSSLIGWMHTQSDPWCDNAEWSVYYSKRGVGKELERDLIFMICDFCKVSISIRDTCHCGCPRLQMVADCTLGRYDWWVGSDVYT